MASKGNTGSSTNKETKPKAIWDATKTLWFIDACVDAVRNGHRPTSHFTKEGWNIVSGKLAEKTGRIYDQKQLKNRWDNLKKEWNIWDKLVGHETGLGWNYAKQTVDATPEWWDRKIQQIPDAAKFREKGLEHCFKLDELFQDIAVTGVRAWAPSSGVLPPRHGGPSIGGDHLEEEHDDVEGDNEEAPRLENIAADNEVENVTQLRKRNVEGFKPTQERRGKRVSAAVKLAKQLDRICDAVESRSMVTRNNQTGSTISDCIEMMSTIPEVTRGGEVFMLGTRLFKNQTNREMFAALKDPDLQLAWLKQEQLRENPTTPIV